jgi:hypothetical protein
MTGIHQQPLDAARRRWLAELAATHQRMPTADTALALARGLWMCGEYDDAIEGFRHAARRAPERVDCQLSLIRSASMLGLRALEDAALLVARERHPDAAELALHAALRRCTDDLSGAAAMLAPFTAQPMTGLFHRALNELMDDIAPTAFDTDSSPLAACWESFRWMRRHASPDAFAGLPVDVLTRALAAAPAEGLTLECGVYFGRSLRIIASQTASDVHGFDSFEGLPEAWSVNEPAGAYSTGGRLPSKMPANVVLHQGWFEQTLPDFFATTPGEIRLLHIDCDLYSSTKTVLQCANTRLVSGSVLVFDDFLGYSGHEQHELRAFEEFVRDQNIGWEVIAGSLLGREVAMRITSRRSTSVESLRVTNARLY